MKQQTLIALAILGVLILILLGVFQFKDRIVEVKIDEIIKETIKEVVLGRETQDEYLIFDGFQGLTSISSYDGGDDTIITETAHGLVAGNVVMFNTSSAAFGGDDTPGFSQDTKYYIVTASISTIFEVSTTKGGTALDLTVASAGGGEFYTKEFPEREFNIENYEHIMCSYNTEEGASLSVFALGSLEVDAPDWYEAKSTDNRYEHIDLIDIEEDAEVEGDTGIRVDDTDTNRMLLVYPARGLKWFTIISENFASGSVDARCKGME